MDPKVLKDMVNDIFLTQERDSKGCITHKSCFDLIK